MKANLSIVILAAGLSQRLGFPKQLILKNGITLLEEKIRLALDLTDKVIVVVPDINTAWAKYLKDIAQQFPVEIVLNPTPHTGMAHSIQLAFDNLNKQALSPASRVLFLTIDQVALTASHLAELTKVTDSNSLTDSQTIIASRYRLVDEPAIIGIPVNMPFGFLATFAPQLQGDKGFGKILNQLSQTPTDYPIITMDLPELVWDIDTPEQFEQLKAKFALIVTI